MIDIKWIRENTEAFDALMKKRGLKPQSMDILEVDNEHKRLSRLIQTLNEARNSKAKKLSAMNDKLNNNQRQQLIEDSEDINAKLTELTTQMSVQQDLQNILDEIPNILDEDVPNKEEVVIRSWGDKPKPHNKHHIEIGQKIGLEAKVAVKMSGSRFVCLKGPLARLERALVNFMLDIHTQEYGFLEVAPPYLVTEKAMYNAGQLPKFDQDSFVTTEGYRLIPTAEVPLVNMVSESILPNESLPLRFVAHTPCFRSEVGNRGRDVRGMIRLHQFHKVELVSITAQEDSIKEHEHLLSISEEILQRLKLPYRVTLLSAQDTGFSAKKTYDLEVWLPGLNSYKEIASCSNCGDFQARRAGAKYKDIKSKRNTFVHTLNSSGLPIGRTMVAILENYVNDDGSVTIPDILVEYMNGVKVIEPYTVDF